MEEDRNWEKTPEPPTNELPTPEVVARGAGDPVDDETEDPLLAILRRSADRKRAIRVTGSVPRLGDDDNDDEPRDPVDDETEDPLLAILRRSADRKRAIRVTGSVPRLGDDDNDDEPRVYDGFRLKKRAVRRPPAWRKHSMLDFTFENPLDGKFKDLPAVQKLVADYPSMVRQVETSYCHYGYAYQKRTVLIGTLMGLTLKTACPQNPCRFLRTGARHPERSAECCNQQKNSLPPGLIDSVIDSWIQRHNDGARRFLLIDVFSGWGSIPTRLKEKWPQVFVYANDIVPREHTDNNLDMAADSVFSPSSLLMFAIRKLWPDDERDIHTHPRGAIGWVQQEKIAVLFHCSTPCRTYSTQALAIHRVQGTAEPKTADAVRDDDMNASLIAFFRRVVLTPPDEL